MGVPALSTARLLDAWEREAGSTARLPGAALLDAVWPEPSTGDWDAVRIGMRDASLLALRAATFGDSVAGLASCPDCGCEHELAFSAHQVLSSVPGDTADDPCGETFTVRSDGYQVTAVPLTGADLGSLTARDPAAARVELLRRSVRHCDGPSGPVGFDELPAGVLDAVEERLAAADPQADLRFALCCADCGHTWEEWFDVAAFYCAELQAWALRTLEDVHRLASAYGWREQEIVEIGPRRRQIYLDLVGT